jgi:YgiT-type zinc finger domain-containing protein
MKCEICGIGIREKKNIDEAFFIGGHWLAVEHIPADVCSHCGEITIDAKTGERIRQLVRSEKYSQKIEMDVFEFA